MTTPSLSVSPNFAASRPLTSAPLPLACSSELRVRLFSHWPDLYARALRLSRNNAVAEDVLQDTFERAMRFEDQFEPNSNLRAWLHRIMVSVFITRCRRQRRERRALENLTHDPCAWTLPEKPADAQTLSPSTERALFSLPVAFRQAVELVDISEMSYRDAATIIGVPLGTVMSRLHRGRKLLADALRETNGTAPATVVAAPVAVAAVSPVVATPVAVSAAA